MTKIKAFKAVRPTRDKAHLVGSRAVASYDPTELAKKLDTNPYTFIHIIHPEFFETDETRTEPNTKERFLKVKHKYEEFLEKGVFKQDEEESLYVYRQSSETHSYLGVIGGASVRDYQEDKIKKHEATLAPREEMFTNYLDVVGFNAEPVLLSHKKSEILDEILAKIVQKRPEYEFTTTDELSHELWVTNVEETQAIKQAYENIEFCYIADGHHRSASSVRYWEMQKDKEEFDSTKNYNYFMSFFIDEERLDILPFNRLCKSLNGLTKEEILEQLKETFEVQLLTTPILPEKTHDIHVFVEEEWYRLRLKPTVYKGNDPVSNIDAELLTRHVLSPILGIHDLTTDENISFQQNEDGIRAIEQSVRSGVYQIGFLLYPVSMEQLKDVANAGQIMPPKSTWIEPKMRSGLTIYKINE